MQPSYQFEQQQLVDALQRLGVVPETAVPLAQAVWTQRRFNEQIRVARTAAALAGGERGSLAPLEEMLASAPAPQQQSPEWRQRAAQTYFTQLGLSAQQAAAAARLYDAEFSARLQNALEAAIERVSSQNAPWKKPQLAEGKKRKMLTDLEKLRRAVRLGVVNPATEWHSELAKENGWHGFTPQQVQRLGEIDSLLADESVPAYRRAQLQAEVQEMVGRAQLPPTLGDYVVSSYTLSALSGLPTFFVQFSAIIAIFRDFVGDLTTNPVIATRALIASLDAFGKEASFALRNNVFTYAVGEHLRDSAPPLRSLLESGIADWQGEHKARGLGKIIVGLQTYVGQVLSAVDQGAIAAAQVYKTSLFTQRSLQALGWSREDAAHVVTAAFDTRMAAFHDAVARGLPADEAGVAANESFRNAVGGRLKEVDAQMAEDVAQGVRSDSLGPVGRLDQLTGNTQEGMLSYPINIVLDSLNHAYRAGSWRALMARVMFGFISIPFRAARWFSGYSPYGFVRYRVHRYRVGQNKDTLWKQSFGTRVQEQQRLRDAIMGTALMSIVAALAGRSGDDDPDKEELKIIVTGKGPSDPAARDIWMKRFQPYSFNVKVGRTYLQMNLGRAFESVAWPLALAGAMDDVALNRAGRVARGSERAFDESAEFLGSYLGSLSQRAAFQSLGKVAASTTKGPSELGKETGQQVVFASSALLPWKSALQSLTRLASEPVDRSTMAGIVIANTPIAGPMLGRPAVNVLGDPVGDNTLVGKLYREGVPLVARFPTDERSRRVYDLILEKGKGPTMVRRSDVESKYGTITDEQFYKYRVERGYMIKAEMMTGADRLRVLDVEAYSDALEKISRRVNPKAAKAAGLAPVPVAAQSQR